jgi:5-methylcytosine-specific restriction enzyme A
MPVMKPCRVCGKLLAITAKKPYCDAHLKTKQREYDDARGSSNDRGYDYHWRTVTRPEIVRRDPFCVIAKICVDLHGDVLPTTEVDHIVPKDKGGKDYPDNLQGACHRCHAWKTKNFDQLNKPYRKTW